jgi:HEAT repeat protein
MEQLKRDLVSPEVKTKQRAVVGLSNMTDSRAIKELGDALEADEDIRDDAAVALVKQGRSFVIAKRDNPVVKRVADILAAGHAPVEAKARAAWVLGEIGERRAIENLKGLAGSGDSLGLEATHALQKLGYAEQGRDYDVAWMSLQEPLTALPEIPPLAQPGEEGVAEVAAEPAEAVAEEPGEADAEVGEEIVEAEEGQEPQAETESSTPNP